MESQPETGKRATRLDKKTDVTVAISTGNLMSPVAASSDLLPARGQRAASTDTGHAICDEPRPSTRMRSRSASTRPWLAIAIADVESIPLTIRVAPIHRWIAIAPGDRLWPSGNACSRPDADRDGELTASEAGAVGSNSHTEIAGTCAAKRPREIGGDLSEIPPYDNVGRRSSVPTSSQSRLLPTVRAGAGSVRREAAPRCAA